MGFPSVNPGAMVITVGPSNPDFVTEVGNSANYILGPTQWEATMSCEDDRLGTAADYAERYEAMWGEPPTYQAAESTATALSLMAAIENAGSLDMDTVRQALFDALSRLWHSATSKAGSMAPVRQKCHADQFAKMGVRS